MSDNMMSGNFVRSSGSLSDRYNGGNYAIRGKNANKITTGRSDVQLLGTLPASDRVSISSNSLTGRSDLDFLIAGLQEEKERQPVRTIRIHATVKKEDDTKDEKKHLTTDDDITVDDIFGDDGIASQKKKSIDTYV